MSFNTTFNNGRCSLGLSLTATAALVTLNGVAIGEIPFMTFNISTDIFGTVVAAVNRDDKSYEHRNGNNQDHERITEKKEKNRIDLRLGRSCRGSDLCDKAEWIKFCGIK